MNASQGRASRARAIVLLAGLGLIGPPLAHDAAADASPPAQRLFSSGFEGDIQPLPPVACWTSGCWQEITGRDAHTGFDWPPRLHGGNARFLLLTDPVPIQPASIGEYMQNRMETVIGPRGKPTRALYQEISRNINGQAPMGESVAQNELQFLPQGDSPELYLSYWLKLQPDLRARMSDLPPGPGVQGGGTWRAIFAFKTGGMLADGRPADDGDYRVEAYVTTYGGGAPYWAVLADNNAGGRDPLVNDWHIINRRIAVPIDRWFRLEVYWRRSAGADGRVWVRVNGATIADHHGTNMGARNLPINRIIAPMLYAGGSMPVYQWVDDLEIWSGLPLRH